MMTHTKGPWEAFYENGKKRGVILGVHGFEVGYAGTYDGGDATLIAAAPDLLEALKDARYALYGNGPGNPKIDAAIAKAEGLS